MATTASTTANTTMTTVNTLNLTGHNLSVDDIMAISEPTHGIHVTIDPSAIPDIAASHEYVQDVVSQQQVVYGITTGLGSFSTVVIPAQDAAQLQTNMIQSHAVGVGPLLSVPLTRAMLALRINTLLRGHSGVALSTIQYLVDMLNRNIVSAVPSKGSVGASGDLAPLCHLMVGYLGHGHLYDPQTQTYSPATQVLTKYQLPCLSLGPKEGLALSNGTQLMTAQLALNISRIQQCLAMSILLTSACIEAVHGTSRAFDERLHAARAHPGQVAIATALRNILAQSAICARYGESVTQDAYSLRCSPQILGPLYELVATATRTVDIEMNSSTDNPLIFEGDVVSGGNFHGQYLAQTADSLKTAVTTLGNHAERLLERLVNSTLSNKNIRHHNKLHPDEHVPELDSFLVAGGGVNSGFMICQYTAAALCADNRVLATPDSIQTIPTCENQEDHVSMGANAVRHLEDIVTNVEHILSLLLLCVVQALEYTPEASASDIDRLRQTLRAKVSPLQRDRFMQEDIAAALGIVQSYS